MDASENPRFQTYMNIVDKYRKMGVRTNADTPADAKIARDFGAEGIGLFRTEHMFYGEGADQPLFLLRKMILSNGVKERIAALDELFVYVKKDIKATLAAMNTLPVTFVITSYSIHYTKLYEGCFDIFLYINKQFIKSCNTFFYAVTQNHFAE